MVREEIKEILAENEASIGEMVKTSLLPELKAAVRESVYKAMEDLTEKPPTSELRSPPSAPASTISGTGPRTSAAGPQTSASESAPPQSAIRNPRPPRLSESQTRDGGQAQSAMGRYLYCIADTGETVSLGNIGIEENEVYTISYDNLCAVVHNCLARPYKSEDREIVKGWVLSHQKVVDAVWEKFGTVIPIGFDTIVQGSAAVDPEENMKKWLKDDYDNLKSKMEKVRDRAEYGVQLFWDRKTIAEKISDESPEIKALNEEIKSKPKGVAYMYRQKLEALLRKEIEDRADRYFKEFYGKITPHADDVRVEKTRKTENEEKQMLLNLSCLLPKEGSKDLGEELEKIDTLEGFSVRYTGPWPPYSFV